ncbi:hypothetical protein RhiirA4_431278 [Rhizophagus irregularis]|uniref:Uncharacterized protein n=1 Tax=Rhizophagus irregularis TaxID=588596 RepID=A0A2I1HP44_9GLOM|nr:hypothetical protein RhiirA4_431278 [Rhizophagus irregularis]
MERTKELYEGESATSEQSHYGLRKKQKIDYNEEWILERIFQSEESQTDDHSQIEPLNSLKIEAQHHLSVADRIFAGENNTSESSLNVNYFLIALLKSVVKSAISNYGLRKKQRIDYNEERISGDQEHFSKAEADIIDFPKIEILASLETKSHLENYNIICFFDVEFPYTKKIFMTLSTNQLDKLKNKWIDPISYTRALQLLRKHSALQDRSSSKYQYRDEIVNPLLSCIFYDVEDAIWMKTGEIENNSQKRQRNFSKPENERERLGDKHDGILCMNVNGVKVEVGFVEVVDNAFTTITSDKNYDLEKLLKAMIISIWYQKAHLSDGNTSNLQSFSILVYGHEFHFLSMHLVNTMYIIDEYSAFVIPDSGMSLSVTVTSQKYYQNSKEI